MDRALLQKYMSFLRRFVIISNTEGQNIENAMHQQLDAESKIQYLTTDIYAKRRTIGYLMESEAAKTDLNDFGRNNLIDESIIAQLYRERNKIFILLRSLRISVELK